MRSPARLLIPAALLGVLSLLLAKGCAGGAEDGPRVVHLARLYGPPAGLRAAKDGRRGFPLSFEVRRQSWTEQPIAGLWRATAPWYRSTLPVLHTEAASFGSDDMRWQHNPVPQAVELKRPGTFAIVREADGDLPLPAHGPGQRAAGAGDA